MTYIISYSDITFALSSYKFWKNKRFIGVQILTSFFLSKSHKTF